MNAINESVSILLEDYELPEDIDETDPQPAPSGDESQSPENTDTKNQQENNDTVQDTSRYSLPDDTDPTEEQEGTDDTEGSDSSDSDILDDAGDNTASVKERDPNRIPDIKVLNLSDTDRKLNNLKLFKQFKELYRDTESTIDGLSTKVTKSARQRQIFDVVTKNLSSMLDDLEIYMQYKFSDVYETNMTVYLTYTKRLKLATELLRLSCDEEESRQK
jgi:hypothetical protein